jgi:hypothetical protein
MSPGLVSWVETLLGKAKWAVCMLVGHHFASNMVKGCCLS